MLFPSSGRSNWMLLKNLLIFKTPKMLKRISFSKHSICNLSTKREVPHNLTRMVDFTSGSNDGISRLISTTSPRHYMVKIQSFSLLTKNNIETYNSGKFKVGGYKWKLILHPNGNKSKNVDGHISLYLMMVVDESSLPLRLDVHAIFRFFLFDQNKDNYLVIQDTVERGRRFDGLIHEWGIDRLVSLEEFENPSNGFLVDDTCVIGAEVYICQNIVTGSIEFLSMTKHPITYQHTWKIDNFSRLDAEFEESTAFDAGNQKWKIKIYPKGCGTGAGTHVSLFLVLADTPSLPPDSQIHAEYTFRILDQDSGDQQSFTAKKWFSALGYGWGWDRFITINDINSPNMGYLRNNSCIVEAEVIVHGVAKEL